MAENYSLLSLVADIHLLYQINLEKEFKKLGIKNLVSSHALILACLYKNKGKAKMGSLATSIKRTKSTVTELVSKLVRLGYVKKLGLKGDKRVIKVVLTELGWGLKEKFYTITGKLLNDLYLDITLKEKQEVGFVLSKIKKNLEQILES